MKCSLWSPHGQRSKESWWVVEGGLNAMGRARPELIAPHVDRLSYWLKHEDWWLRKAAMTALTPVSTDKRFYQQILPVIGEMIANNERAVALQPVGGIVKQLQTADPVVQQFAVQVLGEAYVNFPTQLAAPGGQNLSDGVNYLLDGIARTYPTHQEALMNYTKSAKSDSRKKRYRISNYLWPQIQISSAQK